MGSESLCCRGEVGRLASLGRCLNGVDRSCDVDPRWSNRLWCRLWESVLVPLVPPTAFGRTRRASGFRFKRMVPAGVRNAPQSEGSLLRCLLGILSRRVEPSWMESLASSSPVSTSPLPRIISTTSRIVSSVAVLSFFKYAACSWLRSPFSFITSKSRSTAWSFESGGAVILFSSPEDASSSSSSSSILL